MRHRVKIMVPEERHTLFGRKTVMKERTVSVDGKTYRKMQQAQKNRPYTVEEMMFYDWLFGDD